MPVQDRCNRAGVTCCPITRAQLPSTPALARAISPSHPPHPQEGVSWDRTPIIPRLEGMLPPQVPHLFCLDGDMAVGGGHHNVRGLKLADVGHHLVGVTLGTHPGAQAAGVHGAWGLCRHWRASGHGATVPGAGGLGGVGESGDTGGVRAGASRQHCEIGDSEGAGELQGELGNLGEWGYWGG